MNSFIKLDSYVYNKLLVTKATGGEGRDKLGVWD